MQATSLGDLLKRQAERYGDKPAMLAPDKSGFHPISYREVAEKVRGYAGALKSLGIKRGDRICILADNCPEWAFADWACSSLGIISVPIYATLPADQAQYIVRDAGATMVVAGSGEHVRKVDGMKVAAAAGARAGVADGETLKVLLLTGDGSLDELAKAHQLSQQDWEAEIAQTSREDVYTIIYTSGTTGLPKGAMLQHRAALHVCESAVQQLPLYDTDTFLCFLPMSHVYERIAGQCLPIQMGATIAYARSLASLANDMQKVKPTIMLCVPRFLEAFRDRVVDAVRKESPLKQKLFNLAVSQGAKRAQGGFAPLAGILDKIAMSKVREKTGGKLRFFVSGGAALPKHVAEFLMAVRADVIQGYGLTETSGGTCINHPDRNKYWTVGEPLGMEIKLASDGEILVRGPALMAGYYNLPEETARVIDEEGWFHTGDLGEFEGKSLKITDRKKDIIVLANGKNVAPQPIENKLRSSEYISEAVVYGDEKDYCVALIVPNFEHVRQQLELTPETAIADRDDVRKLIKSEIDAINKTLAPFEAVKRFALLETPFSIENGELTPSMKVKRKVVKEKHAETLSAL